MGKISTQELLDRYFADNSAYTKANQIRLNRDVLYEYEKKVGKELIDMDVDELFGLVYELKDKKSDKNIDFAVWHAIYMRTIVLFRSIFNYYIKNVEPIVNPFNDKRMKGREIFKYFTQQKEVFSWKIVEDIIQKIHVDYEKDKADYIELIMRLYYNGFSQASDIINLKPEDINHKDRSVILPGRIVYLSNRCYDLLVKFYQMDHIMHANNVAFPLVGWHGGYFKFIVQPKKEHNINDRDMNKMSSLLNQYFGRYVNDKYNTKINYKILFFLGFYDFLVATYGIEKTNAMVDNDRNFEMNAELLRVARQYGVKTKNITLLKSELALFMREEVGNTGK